MIEVQATRQSTAETAPGREDYEEKDDRRRRLVPLFFLLFVGSCTAYFKSFLPVKLDASENRDAARGSGANEETVKEDALAAADEPDPEQLEVAKSSGPTERVRISAHDDEGRVPGGSTDFSAQARTGKPKVDTGSGESPKVANDNRLPPRQESPGGNGGGGSGGGGGGGGGGVDRNPRDPPTTDHRNRAPRVAGAVHLPDVVACHGLAISMAALLAGATDPDGDSLNVVGLSSSSGTLIRTEDGGWEFDRAAGMLGEVRLTYAISDGSNIVLQTAYFNVVEAPPIIGTEGDDTLLGTQCAETIVALGGDDNIDARGGDDRISGGTGDDHILAGAGNDVVYAGDGNDIVFAGAGNDVVFGGAGNDQLFGDDGDDTLLGEDGTDQLDGGAGRDILLAGAGDDTLDGGTGNDTLDGGEGADRLAGGEGNDVVTDGGGSDIVAGGIGNDVVLASADAANDSFNGGAGNDTLDYSSAARAIDVNLVAGKASGADIGDDEIAEFEIVLGGAGDDAITVSATSASIAGGRGDDTLTGGAGDDVLAGDAGNDTIADGGGSDTVDGGDGDDVVLASADGADDHYDGNSGHDTLDYSSTTITVTIDLRNGTAQGVEIGRDLIQGFEEIIAGSGDDVIHAGTGSVVLTGGAGNDRFEFQCDDSGSEQDFVKKITDFTIGDRIVAATYEITIKDGDDAVEQVADLFEQIYLEENDGGHGQPVRFRFEELENRQYTAIDVAHGTDAEDVMTIELAGHHHLQFAAIHS